MKLLSYEFDRDKLVITFDTSFSKIKLQKLESSTSIETDCCMRLDCDVMQYTFSKPKNVLSLCTSRETRVVILVIIKVDGLDKNEAMMINKRLDTQCYSHVFQSADGTECIHEQEAFGLADGLAMLLAGKGLKNTKPFEKNESQRIYATIRRKITNGDRQTVSEVEPNSCIT